MVSGKVNNGKTGPTIAQFLYENYVQTWLLCDSDQDREFVTEVSDELHLLISVQQRVISAYPQSSGLVDRQNRSIKKSLFKVLEKNPLKSPSIIEVVLFAHCVSKHSYTNDSPFKLLYNREPVLPIYVKYKLIYRKFGS